MHFRTTFLTLNDWAVITLDAEFALFDFVTITRRVITTDVKFTFWIDEVAVHRSATLHATTLRTQGVSFRVIAFQHVENFVFRYQVDGGFAAFFRRQCITRTTQEHTSAGSTNTHFTTTGRAINTGQNHLVWTHTAFFRIQFSFTKLFAEVAKEVIQHPFPLGLIIGHLVKAAFHLRGEIVVHQLAEVFFQAVSNNFTHLFSVEAAVLYTHIATILDGGND
ncbi:hypothetical protein D3C75_736220 [compost metagenome]